MGGLVVVALALAAVTVLLPRPADYFAHYESYMIGGDGNVYLRVSQGTRDVETLHLDRSPGLDPETGRPVEVPLPEGGLMADAEDRREYRPSYREARRFFVPWMAGEGVLWYWTEGGQVVGYDVMTRRKAGVLGLAVEKWYRLDDKRGGRRFISFSGFPVCWPA